MTVLEATARAKLNLTLDVLGKRPDGYHDLRMVMQEIALGDQVRLTLGTGQPWRVICGDEQIPQDDSNLALKAARLFFAEARIDCGGLTVELRKRTPVCAGMGGGSADGAAVLRLLYAHYGRPFPLETLFGLGEATGSDVPFGLFGGTALAMGKGERLTRLPALPDCTIVLCKPDFPISTPALFREIDRSPVGVRPDTDVMCAALAQGDLPGVANALGNVFEPVVASVHGELPEIRDALLRCGALGASMTGSGPTMFGLFDNAALAQSAFDTLRRRYADTFLTKPV